MIVEGARLVFFEVVAGLEAEAVEFRALFENQNKQMRPAHLILLFDSR